MLQQRRGQREAAEQQRRAQRAREQQQQSNGGERRERQRAAAAEQRRRAQRAAESGREQPQRSSGGERCHGALRRACHLDSQLPQWSVQRLAGRSEAPAARAPAPAGGGVRTCRRRLSSWWRVAVEVVRAARRNSRWVRWGVVPLRSWVPKERASLKNQPLPVAHWQSGTCFAHHKFGNFLKTHPPCFSSRKAIHSLSITGYYYTRYYAFWGTRLVLLYEIRTSPPSRLAQARS